MRIKIHGVDAEICASFLERARGLIGRPRPQPGKGLFIPQCNAVHTFFMRYPIDVTFLDRKGGIVRTVHNIPPWRLLVWGGWRAASALETAADQARC